MCCPVLSSGAEEMAGRQAGSSGASEPSSSPRVSPPKVIVDDSPLQPAMGKHKECKFFVLHLVKALSLSARVRYNATNVCPNDGTNIFYR